MESERVLSEDASFADEGADFRWSAALMDAKNNVVAGKGDGSGEAPRQIGEILLAVGESKFVVLTLSMASASRLSEPTAPLAVAGRWHHHQGIQVSSTDSPDYRGFYAVTSMKGADQLLPPMVD